MEDTKCKALEHSGIWVNANLLEKGIYATEVPSLYGKGTTIDGLIEGAKMAKDSMGNTFVSDKYISNLSECSLVDVVINPPKD